MDDAVQINGLTRRFGDITAVDNLHLGVAPGEMFAIVGPDGAGKTTTFRMLCGILAPTSGSATLLGLDIVRERRKIKREIGYLSQRFSLYGDLTVDENIQFFAEINEVFDFKARREELLEFTRLAPFRRRLAEQLSGGMKQKLALACTLIHQPRLIFLDEPTTGVDPVSRRDFWKILSTLLKSNITIVMSTPYLDEAERCSRVALMNRGRVMVADTPQNIRRLMEGEVMEIICTDLRRAYRLIRTVEHVKDVQTFGDRLNIVVDDHRRDFPAIERRLNEAGIDVSGQRVVSPSLENIFISLMAKEPR